MWCFQRKPWKNTYYIKLSGKKAAFKNIHNFTKWVCMKCVKGLHKLQSLLRLSRIVLPVMWWSEGSWMSTKSGCLWKETTKGTDGELRAYLCPPPRPVSSRSWPPSERSVRKEHTPENTTGNGLPRWTWEKLMRLRTWRLLRAAHRGSGKVRGHLNRG